MNEVPSSKVGVSSNPKIRWSLKRSRMGLMTLLAVTIATALWLAMPLFAGSPQPVNGYKVLPAIKRGNLAIFPVVAGRSHDTSQLMTLDEGVRSGQVTVTESGEVRGLVRPGQAMPPRGGGAEVNRLVLYNNSSRPLLLLAGEIVTGGKQDRVIGADRIVPPETGPIDLSVFCVEPGRWVASSSNFGSMGAQMAQPSVRMPAMADKDQSKFWANVGVANRNMAASVQVDAAAAPSAGPIAGRAEIDGLSKQNSYAKVFESAPVRAKIETYYGGLENEQAILRELRNSGAVGVVVAVNGRVMWADLFASTELLTKYWPKLMRSYVAEAITAGGGGAPADLNEAQLYLNTLSGGREVVETEPGVFRRADITGDGFRVFELTSLLPKLDFDVHITKMRDANSNAKLNRRTRGMPID